MVPYATHTNECQGGTTLANDMANFGGSCRSLRVFSLSMFTNNRCLRYLHSTHSLDNDVPFSPPGHDESFFYIRYPSGAAQSAKAAEPVATGTLSISDQIRAATGNQPMGQITAAVKGMNLEAKSKVDLSKHTEPCRQYLAGENGE